MVLLKLWSNGGWPAKPGTMERVLSLAGSSSRQALELGSGLSTLILGALLSKRGVPLLSVDHISSWALSVRREAARCGLRNVTMKECPLVSHSAFDWYDLKLDCPLASIDFVFCDGPPASTRGGRYGALPVIHPYLAPGALIVVDDTHRPEELEIAKVWAREFDLHWVESSSDTSDGLPSGWTVLQVRDAPRN